MLNRLYTNKNWLHDQYIIKKLSTIEIGKICGCSPEPIRKFLNRFGIPVRSRSEALTGYKKSETHIANMAESLRKRFRDPAKHPNWRGGRIIKKGGYIHIRQPRHPYSVVGYVAEHRLVVEKHIGRYLDPKEIVHHINENRQDNSAENLYLFPNSQEHLASHRSGESKLLKSNI